MVVIRNPNYSLIAPPPLFLPLRVWRSKNIRPAFSYSTFQIFLYLRVILLILYWCFIPPIMKKEISKYMTGVVRINAFLFHIRLYERSCMIIEMKPLQQFSCGTLTVTRWFFAQLSSLQQKIIVQLQHCMTHCMIEWLYHLIQNSSF